MQAVVTIALTAAVAFCAACCRSVTQKNHQPSPTLQAVSAQELACLPTDIRLEQIVTYGNQETSVREKLVALHAECDNGKLVDANKREIRFYRVACFGNPPYNYDEIRQREREEIAQLKQNYTVIVFECNPMMQ
ncbi:MAG: hypothetical protein ALAOOOJD_00444 [bacterium]|nr:hypothetical protein [bacterium]